MSSCVVCSISSRKLDACIIFENDNLICFLDHIPINEGHVLICPKKHYPNITDLPDNLLFEIFLMAKKVSFFLEERFGCNGVSLLQNNGHFNDLGHFHLHVFPRFINDGFSWNSLNNEAKNVTELFNSMNKFSDF
ncbi:HIT family protein [Yersinia enterocolitica]|uniref:HIT family protein n=1 Tax=Yersinia enterocolitica TaxID=630 RepID=UPI001C8DBADF|nr:HIT domain-containing protein [Yersinia enterocolitica]MBX9497557.1 HIT domain-containing protein [Yersinia enterocolitica]